MTPNNFKTFCLCKYISQNIAYECTEVDGSKLANLDGFFIPKESYLFGQERLDTYSSLHHVNLITKRKIFPKKQYLQRKCKETSGLKSWKKNVVPQYFSYNSTNKVTNTNMYRYRV